MLIALPILAANLAFATPSALSQDPVKFSRTYKDSETVVYTLTALTKAFEADAPGTITLDIGLTVTKLLPNSNAEATVHISNEKFTGLVKPAAVPTDQKLTFAENNMPRSISISALDQFELVLLLAASTVDKPVKVGEEYPWKWKGATGTTPTGKNNAVSLDGSTKVLEISAQKKQLKALIKTKMLMDGQSAGEFTFTSVYNISDFSLQQSEGKLSLGKTVVFDFKIVRKS